MEFNTNSTVTLNSICNDTTELLIWFNRLYYTELARRESFKSWTATTNFDVDKAVEIGLYHVPHKLYNDYVICVFCEHTMSNWKDTDIVEEKHRTISPNCVPGKSIALKYNSLSKFIIDYYIVNYYNSDAISNNTLKVPIVNSTTTNIDFVIDELWQDYIKFVKEFNLCEGQPKMDLKAMLETLDKFYESNKM